MPLDRRTIEKTFHITKLKLLEIAPLYPFLDGRDTLKCIEVGGNIGLWCEAFLDIFGDKVELFDAFEPMPANVARFRKRLDENLTMYRNLVQIHEMCVGDKPGIIEINYHREETALASVVVKQINVGGELVNNDKQISVKQVTLDDHIESVGINKVDLVKIDVEGYEWNVLAGMKHSIDSGVIDNIYFEFGKHQEIVGHTFKQFFDFFKERGWRIFRQEVGRNYFGLNEISKYGKQFEDKSSMWMILASKSGPSVNYNGPRVVGRIN